MPKPGILAALALFFFTPAVSAECPPGTMTVLDWGAADAPAREDWAAYSRRLDFSARCAPCPRGAASALGANGWNYCVGGRGDGCRGMSVPSGRPDRPQTCVPCPPGFSSFVINGAHSCLPDTCGLGQLAIPVAGAVLRYECRPPLEDAGAVLWDRLRPRAPEPQLRCPAGRGLAVTPRGNRCEPCPEGLGLVKRAETWICGQDAPAACKPGWGAVLHPLTWRPVACARCPLSAPAKDAGSGYAVCQPRAQALE